ncbi:MAG: Y-family DNA polymerase [Alphaproteobacteria bacterium]|nr:Y-family DNA polymerase [Candidatus Jidaibacter sp.]
MQFSTSSDKTAFHRIALVDCNNFYASCERVFNPKLQHRPIGVLSNNDGCIIARSDELKAAGIKMGAPYFQYKEQLDKMNAVVVSSNYVLYGDMSARVMDVLSKFTNSLEIYSIDEAWIKLKSCTLDEMHEYGRHIVAKTKQYTGIPVSMGIGSTKTLAKVANFICKKRKIPGGVFSLENQASDDEILATIDVADVWGIGRKLSVKLKQHRIFTALDLKRSDPVEMRKRYSVVMQRLIYELNGTPCLTIDAIKPKKEIISSRSFGERVIDKQSLLESVSLHATRAGEKLRNQNSACGCIMVSIRTSHHSKNEQFFGKSILVRLATPTSDTRRLIGAACAGIDLIYKDGKRYAKAGVILMDLVQQTDVQDNLFSKRDTTQSLHLMQTIDQLNCLHGQSVVHFASEGFEKKWRMKRNNRTQAYTTSWQDLPIALAN